LPRSAVVKNLAGKLKPSQQIKFSKCVRRKVAMVRERALRKVHHMLPAPSPSISIARCDPAPRPVAVDRIDKEGGQACRRLMR
jgi:hypothetical protein